MKFPAQNPEAPNENYTFTPVARPADLWPVRTLIVAGLVFMALFLGLYFHPSSWGHPWLYALLTISVLFKCFRLLHEWYHYWNTSITPPPAGPPPALTVDILTTYCPGEPREMVKNTLEAVAAIRYPHTTYLCDEANDPELRQFCAERGIRHVTRTDKSHAKAGNINNALQQATGDLCVVLDPDHVPVPNFFDSILPHFNDPEVGFVQCVQGYYNHKETAVAMAAAEQTYTFYGPMMTCMSHYNTAQAIGANCTFRRTALDSIGGHASGLTEDMNTALKLHAKGWRSVYVPLPLTHGRVPHTLAGFYKQQLKWSRGAFDVLTKLLPQAWPNLTWRQRFHYVTVPLYYLIGLVYAIDLIVPLLSLIWLELPLQLDLLLFGATFGPLFLTGFLIRQYAQRWLIERHEAGLHVIGGIVTSGAWWVYLLGLVYAIARVEVPYLPTPKDDKPRNNFWLVLPNLAVMVASLGAVAYSGYHYGRFSFGNVFAQMMMCFVLTNAYILGFNVLFGQERSMAAMFGVLQLRSPEGSWLQRGRKAAWHLRYGFYGLLRSWAVPLFLLSAVLGVGFWDYYRRQHQEKPITLRNANTQPFYTGVAGSAPVSFTSSDLVIRPDTLAWPGVSSSAQAFSAPVFGSSGESTETLRQASSSGRSGEAPQPQGRLPLLYLQPPALPDGPARQTALRQFLGDVLRHRYDSTLVGLARQVSAYGQPVLLSFAPEFDNPTRPWGTADPVTLQRYQSAWRYVVAFFQQRNVDNALWVWCFSRPQTITLYFPGEQYTDWYGITLQNAPNDVGPESLVMQYQLFHAAIRLHKLYSARQKPIFITRIITPQNQPAQWFPEAYATLRERYPRLRGAVLTPDQANALRDTTLATTLLDPLPTANNGPGGRNAQ